MAQVPKMVDIKILLSHVSLHACLEEDSDSVGQDRLPVDGQEVEMSRAGRDFKMCTASRLNGVRCFRDRDGEVFDDLDIVFVG